MYESISRRKDFFKSPRLNLSQARCHEQDYRMSGVLNGGSLLLYNLIDEFPSPLPAEFL